MILDRNKKPRYCIKTNKELNICQNVEKKKFYNPYNAQQLTPYILVKLLFYLHRVKGLNLERSESSYLRAAAVFLNRYGEKKSEILMIRAAELSTYSWGFLFLNKLGKLYYPDGGDAKKQYVSVNKDLPKTLSSLIGELM